MFSHSSIKALFYFCRIQNSFPSTKLA